MEFREIEGFEGYEISDTGVIRSVDRYIFLSNGTRRFLSGKELRPKINNDGYLTVCLYNSDGKKYFYVHRLVACAFIPNPFNLSEVNHLNGNKQDNSACNLQWVSHAENILHAYNTGLNKNIEGAHHMAVGIIDNYLQMYFPTIKSWCEARCITYSTGKNILCGNRFSKDIDTTLIIKLYPDRLISNTG